MYATVLREALDTTDLTDHLDAGLLAAEWGRLMIPGFIRTCWEALHPELKS
jgi:hypothetical protein